MRSCHPLKSFGNFWENGLRCIQLAEGSAFRFWAMKDFRFKEIWD